MPARNAPSASESPASSVTHASPSVTSSTNSTKSSEDFCEATMWKSGRISRCPTKRTTPSTIAAFRSATAMAPASAFAGSASAGTRTRSGITARSWKSSTPMIWRPAGVCSCACSESVLETIAVDDIASTPPTMSPVFHDSPAASATSAAITSVSATCAPPKPNTVRRIAMSCGRLNSRPTENMRNTTPNSAR